MLDKLKRYLGSIQYLCFRPIINELAKQFSVLQSQHDINLRADMERLNFISKNPLNKYGHKYFSQSDEDGITIEILRRIGLCHGTFVELGVGNGLENNTLILLASGWKGFWIGGEDLAFNDKANPEIFLFFKEFVTRENVAQLIKSGLDKTNISSIDVLSIDLDGNDLYFIQEILRSGINPCVIIAEYNAKFPPPIRWSIEYNENHVWDNSDYFGVSLQLLSDLLSRHSYMLVCCNAGAGTNAFFVEERLRHLFADVPSDISEIYIPCRYNLYKRWGHPPSPRTIEQMLASRVTELEPL